MNETIIKYLTLIGMIAAAIWVGNKFSWASLSTLILCLAGYIRIDVVISRKLNKHDLELFNRLLNALPSDGSIKFIDEFNFAGWSFKSSNLDQLHKFCYEWTTPEFQFLNKKLEKLRAELHKKVVSYLNYHAVNTWVIKGNPEYSSVPEEWEEEQPVRFKEVVDKLHNSSGEIVKLHKELVKLGIKKGLKKY